MHGPINIRFIIEYVVVWQQVTVYILESNPHPFLCFSIPHKNQSDEHGI